MKLDINKIRKTEKKILYMWKFKNILKKEKNTEKKHTV